MSFIQLAKRCIGLTLHGLLLGYAMCGVVGGEKAIQVLSPGVGGAGVEKLQ